jgi:hypothetical protein
MTSSELIRQDIVPIVTGYVLLMGALAIGLRISRRSSARRGAADAGSAAGQARPASSQPAEPDLQEAAAEHGFRPGRLNLTARVKPGWRRLAVHSLAMAVGGYLVLMAVIISYYFGVAPPNGGNFVESAFSGCAMLLGLAAPVFLALSWLAYRKGWKI